MNAKKIAGKLFPGLIPLAVLFFWGCSRTAAASEIPAPFPDTRETAFSLEEIPPFSGEPFAIIRRNLPEFDDADRTAAAFERYSELDALGRCGPAYANLCRETMPIQPRQPIGMVRPPGWHTVRYDGLVEGNYLYNRCHLIGFCLSGENANERNLITGTRYMNTAGMYPFESIVRDYLEETGNHVLYRATPVFEGENLIAAGIHLEAASIEDSAICFNVFVYNVQPGIRIDYQTGASRPEEAEEPAAKSPETLYILNISTRKFHNPSCVCVRAMKEENRRLSPESRESLIPQGYSPCGRCHP